MRAPAFWWRRRRSLAALALWPASRIWGGVVARRMRSPPSFRPPVPVICVGNFTAGGEGKTPTALALAVLARAEGLRPGFLTRGYGGSARGPLLVGPTTGPDLVGDEALLLARAAPTAVAGDRAAGARHLLAGAEVEIIIMDDGFQNPGLAKDLSLIVADGGGGLGNRMVIPSGPLRAPLAAQIRQTDAIVIVGDGPARAGLTRLAARSGRRFLSARLVPVHPAGWDGSRVIAFAGIGRPEKFFARLEAIGAKFVSRVAFPDHHVLSEDDARTLLGHVRGSEVRLVTTEKDFARLGTPTSGALAELRERTEVFPVRLEFDDPAAVRVLIRALVERTAGRRASALPR